MTRISLAERSAQIQRKLDAGFAVPPVDALANRGSRRSLEKANLLRKLRDEAARRGRALPFVVRV